MGDGCGLVTRLLVVGRGKVISYAVISYLIRKSNFITLNIVVSSPSQPHCYLSTYLTLNSNYRKKVFEEYFSFASVTKQ